MRNQEFETAPRHCGAGLPDDGLSDINHFIDLVHQGKRPGCSTSEANARKLAKAIVKHAPGLDCSATEGLKKFIDMAQMAPMRTAEIIG